MNKTIDNLKYYSKVAPVVIYYKKMMKQDK